MVLKDASILHDLYKVQRESIPRCRTLQLMPQT